MVPTGWVGGGGNRPERHALVKIESSPECPDPPVETALDETAEVGTVDTLHAWPGKLGGLGAEVGG